MRPGDVDPSLSVPEDLREAGRRKARAPPRATRASSTPTARMSQPALIIGKQAQRSQERPVPAVLPLPAHPGGEVAQPGQGDARDGRAVRRGAARGDRLARGAAGRHARTDGRGDRRAAVRRAPPGADEGHRRGRHRPARRGLQQDGAEPAAEDPAAGGAVADAAAVRLRRVARAAYAADDRPDGGRRHPRRARGLRSDDRAVGRAARRPAGPVRDAARGPAGDQPVRRGRGGPGGRADRPARGRTPGRQRGRAARRAQGHARYGSSGTSSRWSPRRTPGGWSGCCATSSSTPWSTARARTSWSSSPRRGGAVAVAVRDYGVGLKPGEATRVFSRFWRADPARARTTGGTGLGLSIALEDARLHGGWLQAWGEPGGGSQFRLTLPRTADEPLRGSPIPLEPKDSRRNRGLNDAGLPPRRHAEAGHSARAARQRACRAAVRAGADRAPGGGRRGPGGAARQRRARGAAAHRGGARPEPPRRRARRAPSEDGRGTGEGGAGTGGRLTAGGGISWALTAIGAAVGVRCALVAYGVCGAVLLAGCASMPDGGDLRGVEASQRPDPQVRVFAMPPRENAQPEEIVQGFLEALTSDDPGFETARKYLTGEAAKEWRPNQSTTVLADGPNTAAEHSGSREATGDYAYSLTGTKVATVDSQFAYEPADGDVQRVRAPHEAEGEGRQQAVAHRRAAAGPGDGEVRLPAQLRVRQQVLLRVEHVGRDGPSSSGPSPTPSTCASRWTR